MSLGFCHKTGFKTKPRQRNNFFEEFIDFPELMLYRETGFEDKPPQRDKSPEHLFIRLSLVFLCGKTVLKLNLAK